MSAEQLAAVERESARTWAETEQNPDGALARENRAMCNAGRWNTEGFKYKNWLEAMKHCGPGRTLCDTSEPCKGSGCSYDKIYQWTSEECQEGDNGYPAACTTAAKMPQPTPWPTPAP